MDSLPPRSESPAFVPQPLSVRPRRPATARPGTSPITPTRAPLGISSNDDDGHPLLTLCAALHVAPPPPPLSSDLPQMIELLLTNPTSTRAALPTHVLAIYDTPTHLPDPHVPPLLVPVSAPALTARLRPDAITLPASSRSPATHARALRVPLVPLRVSHASSFPLLLLPSDAIAILPPESAARLPDVSAAARVLARSGRMQAVVEMAQGAWRNALALGLVDERALSTIRIAWNVAAEAKRVAGGDVRRR